MIEQVSISNYKSILFQQFSLGRVNMFIGHEGSGKTNILEAFGIASAAHDETLDTNSLQKRGIKVSEPSLIFNRQSPNKEIVVSWNEKKSWKKAKLISDDNATWKDISWFEPEYITKINNLIKFVGDGTISGEYPFEDEAQNIALNAAFRASRNFRDYQIYDTSSQHDVALIIGNRTPLIFAIDNIETSLAQCTFNDLIQSISNLSVQPNKQAFITTSNPDIVKCLNLADTHLKLFLVKKGEDGNTLINEQKDITFFEV